MYDAVTAGNIPAYALMVAGYDDGLYRWTAADWARFPNAVHVHIAVHPSTNTGQVLDVEQGDATPAQAPGWVQMRRQAGQDPSVYCSLAVWPEVQQAFIQAGVGQPHYWIAAYPGNGANLYLGSVAHQYSSPGPYDVSVVADFWPGVDGGETDMPLNADDKAYLENLLKTQGISGAADERFNGVDKAVATILAKLALLDAKVGAQGTTTGKVTISGELDVS